MLVFYTTAVTTGFILDFFIINFSVIWVMPKCKQVLVHLDQSFWIGYKLTMEDCGFWILTYWIDKILFFSSRLNHVAAGLVSPSLKSDTSSKEIEEAMKRVREAQSLISAAIEPGNFKSWNFQFKVFFPHSVWQKVMVSTILA